MSFVIHFRPSILTHNFLFHNMYLRFNTPELRHHAKWAEWASLYTSNIVKNRCQLWAGSLLIVIISLEMQRGQPRSPDLLGPATSKPNKSCKTNISLINAVERGAARAECWWWYYSLAQVYKHKLDWYLNGFSIPHLGHHQLQVQWFRTEVFLSENFV